MKAILRLFIAVSILLAATNSFAWFFDDDDWECMGPFGKIPGCNPYDEWDPRYWMEEMEQEFDDDDDYYRYGPYGGYGPGYGYGSYGPYGYAPYGPGYGGYAPYGYAPYGPGYGYAPYGPGYGYAPYGYAPAPATTTQ
jgi:hypothetical protein